MKYIEDHLIDKLYELTNYTLSKFIKPDLTFETITDLDPQTITTIKQSYGIEGIILDVDDTLRKNMQKIPPSNKAWLEQIKKQLKVIVVSNGVDKQVEQYLQTQGIDYIGFARKPLKVNFKRACQKMHIKPEQVLVIGDSLWADIYGGQRNNMFSALIKRVNDEER